MSIVEKARLFALKAHGDQKYSKEFPYEKHLNDVVGVVSELYPESDSTPVMRYSPNDYVLCAAWLHDTLEDTEITFRELFDEFGREIARTVLSVTDEPGKNRRERHDRTYPKIMAGGRNAIAVKLADRIANVRHSLQYNHSMFEMYKREYPEFRKALHLPGELKEMWSTLDVLMEHNLEAPKK